MAVLAILLKFALLQGKRRTETLPNIFQLLLSSKPPWPMMLGGLLHSPPPYVDANQLFEQIGLCVCPEQKISRFSVVETLKKIILMQLEKKK